MDRVLVISLKHLGDLLTTSPVVGGVKKAWPKAKVWYLVNPGAEDLVRFHPEVEEVFSVPRSRGPWAHLDLIRTLRSRRFDLAIELSGGDRGAFLSWISGAKVRVGLAPLRPKLLDRRMLFSHLVTSRVDSKHTVEYHLDALRVLGQEPGHQPLSLHWPPEAGEQVLAGLKEAGIGPDRGYAVVHPTSRWMFKSWKPEANAEVIRYLIDRLGLAVVVTSAPDDKEIRFSARVLELADRPVLDLCGRLSLPEMASLLAGARLFFGVDSLPMHMAAAVGTPAVVLFGPSGEHMWAPWGPGHFVVAKDWACRPCGRDGCNGSKVSRCLEEITPDEVFPALDQAAVGSAL